MILHWLSTPATLVRHWEKMAGSAPVVFLGPMARGRKISEGQDRSFEPLHFDWPRLCLRLLGEARIPVGRLFRQVEIDEILRAALRDDRCASVAAFQGVLQRPGQVRRLSDRLKRTAALEYAEAEALPWFADESLEILRRVYQEKLAAAGGIDVPGLFLKFLGESQEETLRASIDRWQQRLVASHGEDLALIVPRVDRLLEESRKFERAVTLVLIDRFRNVHLGSHAWPDDSPERFEHLTAEWATLGAELRPLPPEVDVPESWFIDIDSTEQRDGLIDAGRIGFVETRDPKAEIAAVAENVKGLIEGGIALEEIEIRTPQHVGFVDRLREALEEAGVAVEPPALRLVESPQVRTLLDVAAAIEDDWPAEAMADLLRHHDFRRSAFAAEVSLHDTARLALQIERLGNVNGIELIRRMLLVRADEQAARSRDREAGVSPMLIAVEALTNLETILVPPPVLASWYERVEDFGRIVSGLFETEFSGSLPVERFFESLEKGVGNLVSLDGSLWSWRDFLRECQLRAEAWTLSEPGEARQGLRITRGDFEDAGTVGHLVLAGMTEGHFPSRSRIRDALVRQEHVDLESLRAGELRRFREAVGAAGETLWVSYHRRDERGVETEPAGFLRGTKWSTSDIPTRILTTHSEAGDPEFLLTIDAAKQRVRSRIGPYAGELANPLVLRDLADRFGPGYLFSATSLETASLCPFRFFGSYVLGFNESEIDDDLSTDYLAEGETIHTVLEDFHRSMPIADIERLSDEAILEKLESLVAQRHPCPPRLLDSELGRSRWEVQNRRITMRLASYAAQLRRDLEPPGGSGRSKGKTNAASTFGGDFDILQCELRAGQTEAGLKQLRVSGGDSGGDFRIGGRIDRIDGQPTGEERRVRVLDYKTGAAITEKDLRAKLHLQLPIYAMMVQESRFGDVSYRVEDLGFWYLKPSRGGYVSIRDWLSPGTTLDVELLKIEYEPFLQSLVAGIRTGGFLVRPRSANCEERCELAELCRIRERRQRKREEGVETSDS